MECYRRLYLVMETFQKSKKTRSSSPFYNKKYSVIAVVTLFIVMANTFSMCHVN